MRNFNLVLNVLLLNFFVCPWAYSKLSSWEVLPLPETAGVVSDPVQSLNGIWKINLAPPDNFWELSGKEGIWKDVIVPGEPAMQGFAVQHDQSFGYLREFSVPKFFRGQRVFLRFEGVYSQAEVWVNGNYIRDHIGGFTSWDCEITDSVEPGQDALLAVEVVDRLDDISFASGYAQHPIGGILRDVYLYCLPQQYIRSLDVQTDLDEDYTDAVLKIHAELSSPAPAVLHVQLKDPAGKKMKLNPDIIRYSDKALASVEIPIAKPRLWDAEHPHLYTLTVDLKSGSKTVEQVIQKVGFREVEIQGNKILVNGKQIHLRGANRHDIHPVLGRTSGQELDLQDVLLAKEANMNFIRTSHYPPSKAFLEYCDQYGLYVEEETAVCFIGQAAGPYGPAIEGSQDKPEFTSRFLSQLTEMIDRDRNHPSVIIWSIGNENKYGQNFQKSYELARELDSGRPVIFSYPGMAGENRCYDIESQHYPFWNGVGRNETVKYEFPMKDFCRLERPILCDEWAHVACYPKDFDITRDPGIRNFWGQSLKKMWENAFVSNGTSGGAIWGMIDETFQLPDRCVGYGEWGIYDTWRRKKPEFWLTKKAYSPIRINETAPLTVTDGKLEIPVKNWFDHTNFSELLIQWQMGEKSGVLDCRLAPGQAGKLVIPVGNDGKTRRIFLNFYNTFNQSRQLIDQFHLPILVRQNAPGQTDAPVPQIRETEEEITITGKEFEIVFDKQNGMIKKGIYGGEILLTGGPRLNLTPMAQKSLQPKKVNAQASKKSVKVVISGAYDQINVTYVLLIDGNGTIETSYTILNPPSDSAMYHEVGVTYDLPEEMNLLRWERNGLYSIYPDDHIGRNRGQARKISEGKSGAYRQRPDWPWALDMYDYFYYGKDHHGYAMTHDFRSTKESIRYFEISEHGAKFGLRIESDGKTHAVRLAMSEVGEQKKALEVHINKEWAYHLAWGNINRVSQIGEGFTDSFTMRFVENKAR